MNLNPTSMKKVIIVLFGLLLCSQAAKAQVDTIKYGLKGKIIRAFEQSTVSPNTYYAGLKGASFGTGHVYKSTDAGVTWHVLNNGEPIDPYVADIQAVAESKLPNPILWAGTWKNGMFKSLDYGETWVKDMSCPSSDIRSIRTGIQNPSLIYAATSTFGVIKSTDRGATWHRNTPAVIDSSFAFAWSIEIDPVDDRIIYAQTFGDGVWRSVDQGDSWTQLLDTDGQVAWDMKIADHGELYVAASKRGASESTLYHSTDGGATWVQVSDAPQIGINQIATHEHDGESTIYVGSWQDGVYQLMGGVWSKVDSVDHGTIAHILNNENGVLIGSWGNGIYQVNHEH